MKVYDFGAVPPNIQDMLGRNDHQSFFNLPEWYALVAQHGLKSGSAAGFVLADDTRVGLAFSRLPRDHVLRSCTNLYTCEFAVQGACLAKDSVAKFARALASSLGPLNVLQLEGLDPASPSFRVLLDGIRSAGFVAKPYFGWANWYEATGEVDFAHYLATRPSTLRNTWKRKSSQLQKLPQSEFRIYRDVADPEPLIAVYEQLREQSWKSAEPYPAFIPGLIRLAARLGALRFGALDIDGAPAAAQFWIVWAGRATIFKLVHSERFAAHSPGTLLTMEMMRQVFEDDHPAEIDFGRGDDGYKKLWLRSRRERWGIEAANPRTPRGLIGCGRIIAGAIRHSLAGDTALFATPLKRPVSREDSLLCSSSLPGFVRKYEAGRPMYRPS
jgi:hypothetical protein